MSDALKFWLAKQLADLLMFLVVAGLIVLVFAVRFALAYWQDRHVRRWNARHRS